MAALQPSMRTTRRRRARGAPLQPARLTNREREVLGLLSRRYTDAEIAEQLYISTRTASTHVANILHKLGAANRREAGAIAVQFRLA